MRHPSFPSSGRGRAAAAAIVIAVGTAGTGALDAQGGPTEAFRARQQRRAGVHDQRLLAAIQRGIAWLAGHQDDDGRFGAADFATHDPADQRCTGAGNAGEDVGVTGLALLAMLGPADLAHADACHRAAKWLTQHIDLRTGRSDGPGHDAIYGQAIATLALLDAAAMLGNADHRDAAARSLVYLEQHHNPGAAWRYLPHNGENDSSVTSWCLASFALGARSGIDVSARTVGEALAWLDSVTEVDTGWTSYTKLGEPSSRVSREHADRFPIGLGDALTAAGLHARLMCGMSPDDPVARAAMERLVAKPPIWDPPAIDFYYWLQGSLAIALMPKAPEHKRWNDAVQKALLPNQCRAGSAAGSWDPIDVWGETGGRVYATAAAVLCLASAFRAEAMTPLGDLPASAALHRAEDLLLGGKAGQVPALLAGTPPASLSPADQQARQRLTFHLEIGIQRATRVLEALDRWWDYSPERLARLEYLAAATAGLPIGEAAQQRLALAAAEPAVRAELQATRELRPMLQDASEVLRGNKTKKKRLVEQLTKLAAKYPTTPTAERVRELLQQLQ